VAGCFHVLGATLTRKKKPRNLQLDRGTSRKKVMPTKRTFDLVIITALLVQPATGLVRMVARRWVREEDGAKAKAGAALVVSL